jgi:hypothetical protein
MSMSTFLFAADALRLEEGVGFRMEPVAGVPSAPEPVTANRNAQAMAALGPALALAGKKKRR